MIKPERVCNEKFLERELFVLELETPDEFPDRISLSSPRFACLLALDAREVKFDNVGRFARKLLDSGAAYICVWGPDCERVHDIIDQEEIGPNPPPVVDRVVITTWHAESLAEATWNVLFCSCPDEPYAAGCDSTLGISIGSREWATEIRSAFSDPTEFSARMLKEP
jgi:hypothetical protein